MGLKRRNKISAQFSMSSLTDIIFLLLIFFMLTSSLIVPNALNLKLPGESRTTTTISKRLDQITIQRSGKYIVNGRSVSSSGMYTELKRISKKGKDTNIIVSPHPQVPNRYVVEVLDAARKLRLNAILSEPR